MIIYIDKSIKVHGHHRTLSDAEKDMFVELACAHRRGDCYLCGDIDSIGWLMRSVGNSYRGIQKRFAETRSLIEKAETVIVISYDATPNLPKVFFEHSIKARVVTVQQAIHFRLNAQCILLGENLNDCIFYKLLAERYLYSELKGSKGISISFQQIPGGGDTTSIVLDNCVASDNRLTLCVVDSDIKYGKTDIFPQEPAKGGTVDKLNTVKYHLEKSTAKQLFDLLCLDVHEVENLIPLSILREIAETTVKDMLPGVEYLEGLLKNGYESAILCYDFKNGSEKLKSAAALTYWFQIAESMQDYSMPALCSKILVKAIDALSTPLPSKEKKVVTIALDSYLESRWYTIGKTVFSWGCANRPSRS